MIEQRFGDDATDVLRRTNLYAPSQVMAGVEDLGEDVARGKAEATLLRAYEGSGPLRKAYIRLMLDGIATKNQLGRMAEKAIQAVPLDKLLTGLITYMGVKETSQAAGDGGALPALKAAMPYLVGLDEGALLGMVDEIMKEAQEAGYSMVANSQEPWDLMAGVYTGWGRAGVDPDPPRHFTLDSLVRGWQDEGHLSALVHGQSIRFGKPGVYPVLATLKVRPFAPREPRGSRMLIARDVKGEVDVEIGGKVKGDWVLDQVTVVTDSVAQEETSGTNEYDARKSRFSGQVGASDAEAQYSVTSNFVQTQGTAAVVGHAEWVRAARYQWTVPPRVLSDGQKLPTTLTVGLGASSFKSSDDQMQDKGAKQTATPDGSRVLTVDIKLINPADGQDGYILGSPGPVWADDRGAPKQIELQVFSEPEQDAKSLEIRIAPQFNDHSWVHPVSGLVVCRYKRGAH